MDKTIIKNCEKCGIEFNAFSIHGEKKCCSTKCARSRGPRTEDFKIAVSNKLSGRKISPDVLERRYEFYKSIATPSKICISCNVNTARKYRKTCSDECYRRLIKLNSRNHPNCGGQKHTNRSKMFNIDNIEFTMESSYEVIVAESLNNHNVLWIRPGYLLYRDSEDLIRRYYPDFYLPEYDLFLDPKNDYLIKTDIDKINTVANQNSIRIFILGKDFLKYETFRNMVGSTGDAPMSSACKTEVLLLNEPPI